VDAMESELRAKLKIVRVDVQETIGRELAPVYSFEYTPTFILFDSQGHELWRTIGEIDPQRVRGALNGQN
jgi:thioredoxin-related protein